MNDIKLQKAKDSAQRTITGIEWFMKNKMPIPEASIELYETVKTLYDAVVELEDDRSAKNE